MMKLGRGVWYERTREMNRERTDNCDQQPSFFHSCIFAIHSQTDGNEMNRNLDVLQNAKIENLLVLDRLMRLLEIQVVEVVDTW